MGKKNLYLSTTNTDTNTETGFGFYEFHTLNLDLCDDFKSSLNAEEKN